MKTGGAQQGAASRSWQSRRDLPMHLAAAVVDAERADTTIQCDNNNSVVMPPASGAP
jgi:hypothetical protein